MNTAAGVLEKTRSLAEPVRRSTLMARPIAGSGLSQFFEIDLKSGGSRAVVPIGEMLETLEGLKANSNWFGEFLANRTGHASVGTAKFPNSPMSWLNLARAHMNAIEFEHARVALEKALELDPANPTVLKTAGRLSALEGKMDEAEEAYRNCLDSGFDYEAVEAIAAIQLARGDFTQAIEELERADEVEPSHGSLQMYLGVAYLSLEKWGKAIAHLRKATSLEPSSESFNMLGVGHHLAGNAKKAERSFRSAIQLDMSDPEPVLNLAKLLNASQRWTDSVAPLESLLTRFPDHWVTRDLLGVAEFHIGNVSNALRHFEWIKLAIERGDVDAKLGPILNNVAVCHLNMGDIETAESLLRKCAEDEKLVNVDALFNLARLLIDSGQLRAAGKFVSRIEEKYPESKQFKQASAEFAFANEDYDLAANVAEDILSDFPFDPDAAAMLSAVQTDFMGRFADAEQLLRKAWKRSPRHQILANNLAYSLILQGKLAEAEVILASVDWDAGTSGSIAKATEGLLRIKQGLVREGSALYNSAASSMPSRRKKFKDLILQKKELEIARHFWGQENLKEARRHLEKALSYQPASRMYHRQAVALAEQVLR